MIFVNFYFILFSRFIIAKSHKDPLSLWLNPWSLIV